MGATEDIEFADYLLSTNILSALYCYMNGIFVVQTLAFVCLMIALRSATMRKSLSVYSWCLTTNVVTIYLFECLMFALKPVVIPSGVYVLLDGPAGFLPISIRFIGFWIFLLMLLAHVAAMATSVLYQWAQITPYRPTWFLQAREILKTITHSFDVQNRLSTALVFLTLTCAVYGVLAGAVLRMSISLFPGDSIDASERVLMHLLQHIPSGCVRFNISQGSGLVVLLVVFSVASLSVLGVLGYVIWESYRFAYKSSLQSRTSRTVRMQLDLIKSITAQTVALVVLYLVPCFAIFGLLLTRPSFMHRLTASIHFLLYSYAPVTYCMIFIFVPRLRVEATQRIRKLLTSCGFCKPKSASGKVSLTRDGVGVCEI